MDNIYGFFLSLNFLPTRSLSVDLEFLENFNFHGLMFLKVYKHVFTQVRLCTSIKFTLTLYTIHIALNLICIFLEQGINSAKSMFFGCHFKIPGWIFFIFMFLHSYKAYAHEFTWIWLCTSQKSRSILRLGVIHTTF